MDDVAGLGSGAFAYTFVVSSASKAAAAGGASTANITTGADVAWTATLKSGTGGTVGTPSGTGSGPVTVNFDANTGAERSVTVTIATTASNVTGTKTYDVVFTQSEAGAAAEKIATFDIPNMGLTTQAEWGTQTVNGITITGAGGGNTNTPKFYNGTSTTVTALRTYKDNTLTFTGGTITKIEWEDGTRKDGVTANTGAVAGTVWTGSSTSVVLTTASTTVTNPQQHYVKITVTYN